MDEAILDLSTLVERPIIAIDGVKYEIRAPDELAVLDHQRFAVLGRQIDELQAIDEPTDDQLAELQKKVVELSERIMVAVPADVAKKLTHAQRLAVIEVFTTLSLRRRVVAAAAKILAEAANRSTGANTSHGSNGSTEETPTGGSPAPPSPSSAPTSP